MVYYANYLRYFERARTEFLRDHGFELSDFSEKGVLCVVGHAEIIGFTRVKVIGIRGKEPSSKSKKGVIHYRYGKVVPGGRHGWQRGP